MGLLDDAIREHLDLKRRRGADPTEVDQAEREALGPVRRAPETLEPDEFPPGTHNPPGSEEYDYERGAEEPYADEPYAEGPYAEEPYAEEPPAARQFEEPLEPPPAPYDPESHPAPYQAEPAGFGSEGHEFDELEPLPAHEPPPAYEPAPAHEPPPAHEPAPAADQPAGGETVEYRLEDAEDEDVLEETPEFLQDTPEHDRLWFEQRPPRDFDFDG